MNSEAEDAWDSLMSTYAALERVLDKQLTIDTGLSSSSYYLLRVLSTTDDLTMTDLSDRLRSDRTNVSRRVDALERDGLVERKANPRDGRSRLVALTSEGRVAMSRALPIYQALIERRVGGSASAAQLRELAATLNSLGEIADSPDGAGPR